MPCLVERTEAIIAEEGFRWLNIHSKTEIKSEEQNNRSQ